MFAVCADDRSSRDLIYAALLRSMSPEHKFNSAAKLCGEVLAGVADGLLPLSECEEVLRDALCLMACKEIKVGTILWGTCAPFMLLKVSKKRQETCANLQTCAQQLFVWSGSTAQWCGVTASCLQVPDGDVCRVCLPLASAGLPKPPSSHRGRRPALWFSDGWCCRWRVSHCR